MSVVSSAPQLLARLCMSHICSDTGNACRAELLMLRRKVGLTGHPAPWNGCRNGVWRCSACYKVKEGLTVLYRTTKGGHMMPPGLTSMVPLPGPLLLLKSFR